MTGIDIDPKSIQVATARLSQHSNANFQVLDIEAVNKFELPQLYDIIYCRLLLSHLKDPLALLQKLKPLLSPSGQLIVEDHDNDDSCYPKNLAFSTFASAWIQLGHQRQCCYNNLVDMLPLLYEKCQLNLKSVHVSKSNASELSNQVMAQSIFDLREAMIQEQILSESIFDALYAELLDFFSQPYTHVFLPTCIRMAGSL